MADQKPQKPTPPGKIRAVNKKGTVTFFDLSAWKNLENKIAADGSRNGWSELKDGENPADVVRSANIPPEMMTADQRAKLHPTFSDEEKKSMIAAEVKQQVEAATADMEAAHETQIEELKSDHAVEIQTLQEESQAKDAEISNLKQQVEAANSKGAAAPATEPPTEK